MQKGVSLPGNACIEAIPKGTVLIISPFNCTILHPVVKSLLLTIYADPFSLAIGPLISAIAAGNTCVLKLSELAQATSMAIAMHLNNYIPKDIVSVVLGGPSITQFLLKQKFDHIFFTGSERVGKIVMKAAAEHLTPGI
jgi:aldehyde dehydrogenase (NAD+)